MKQYTASFLSIMSNFVSVYQDLLVKAKTKTEILVAGDIKELEILMAQETELMRTIGKIEIERGKLMEQWSTDAGWPAQSITFQFIGSQLSEIDRETAHERVLELDKLVRELKEVNKTNNELIERALQFVNYSVELLSGVPAGGMTYGANGDLGERQAFKVFDHKA